MISETNTRSDQPYAVQPEPPPKIYCSAGGKASVALERPPEGVRERPPEGQQSCSRKIAPQATCGPSQRDPQAKRHTLGSPIIVAEHLLERRRRGLRARRNAPRRESENGPRRDSNHAASSHRAAGIP